MFRITNLMPVYEKDGSILEYRISVDNGSADGNSVSANLVVKSTDIDITAIAEVCKQKLRETVGQMLFINDNKLYLLIRKKETNGKKY